MVFPTITEGSNTGASSAHVLLKTRENNGHDLTKKIYRIKTVEK